MNNHVGWDKRGRCVWCFSSDPATPCRDLSVEELRECLWEKEKSLVQIAIETDGLVQRVFVTDLGPGALIQVDTAETEVSWAYGISGSNLVILVSRPGGIWSHVVIHVPGEKSSNYHWMRTGNLILVYPELDSFVFEV